MSDTTKLRHQIHGAGELQSVVRTMKAVAASSIGQYEQAARALDQYCHTIELGLGACFRNAHLVAEIDVLPEPPDKTSKPSVRTIVFGSDQGLVGPFNDVIADFAVQTLAKLSRKSEVWAVGDRVSQRLADAGTNLKGSFSVPSSVKAITALIGQLLLATESQVDPDSEPELYIIFNRPGTRTTYVPVSQRLLPLDAEWQSRIVKSAWPTNLPPQTLGDNTTVLRALIHEYLFVTLFRACVESLVSENASRLAAMQRADQNINDLLKQLNESFHRVRQGGIDEELFDVISGFEALGSAKQ
ncbi:MAG: alternate ATPase, subunit gamma [Planctomycetaceae bacterium]|nr:alternate ATPase, subunit gamma [Planctomycetaceae bacterium]